jgi:hypothetical protein
MSSILTCYSELEEAYIVDLEVGARFLEVGRGRTKKTALKRAHATLAAALDDAAKQMRKAKLFEAPKAASKK